MSRLIVFDVDSTLIQVESLDFAIRKTAGHGATSGADLDRLDEITAAGMSGQLDFRQSLQRRLEMARLSRDLVQTVGELIAQEATPGMDELVARLRDRGRLVHAVSGGFMDLIWPALKLLGFAETEVQANRFEWTDDCATGFDTSHPLSRNGGKAEIVQALKSRTAADIAIMVGDGITDYEAFAAGAADGFIGFGGVQTREVVRDKAPSYAATVEELSQLLLG